MNAQRDRIRPAMSAALTALALALPGMLSAGEAPLGHRDFYPSSERPIGFSGDGNGYFPGATPVTEWWEGTPKPYTYSPVESAPEVKPRDGDGAGGSRKKPGVGWDYADNKSKNIVWKTALPGWSMAPPIVVGDRVFAVGEPHHLVCLDARQGKVLWSREVLALELGGKSYARNDRFKLTNHGDLFDMKEAPFKELPVTTETDESRAARKRLQEVLDQNPAKTVPSSKKK